MNIKQLEGKECRKGNKIQIMSSAAGYFLGTEELDRDLGIEIPCCRITGYYSSEEQLRNDASIEFRHCCENEFCNKGEGCLKIGGRE